MTEPKPIRMDDEWSYSLHMTGAAHSVSSQEDEECEAVLQLRQVVEEITGKPVIPPCKQRIGFLP